MFKLFIQGSFRGNFKTSQEAFVQVEKFARPFHYSWKIEDPLNKIVARS